LNEENSCSKTLLPGVSVICSTNRTGFMEQVFANYLRQIYLPREFIIVLNNNSMDLEKWRAKAAPYVDIRVHQLDEDISLGECLNFAIEQANFDYIANMSDDDYYASPYLERAMDAFTYTDADVVGKGSLFVYFEASKILATLLPDRENRYVQAAAGATLVFKKEVFGRVRFPDVNLGEDTVFVRKCVEKGIKIYANDRFNFVYLRRPNPDDHTWKVTDDALIQSCEVVSQTDDYITPITR